MTHAVSAASKGDAVKPLHNASTADSYADLPFLPAGGVASAKGFKACGGVHHERVLLGSGHGVQGAP